jgi:hypothetical protein
MTQSALRMTPRSGSFSCALHYETQETADGVVMVTCFTDPAQARIARLSAENRAYLFRVAHEKHNGVEPDGR